MRHYEVFMKNVWLACAISTFLLATAVAVFRSEGAEKEQCGLTVTKVFGSDDEVVLRLSVETAEPLQYVIRNKDRSGEGAVYATTSRLSKAKRCEGTSWIIASRIKPNGEDHTFEKIIVQHGTTNSMALGRILTQPPTKR